MDTERESDSPMSPASADSGNSDWAITAFGRLLEKSNKEIKGLLILEIETEGRHQGYWCSCSASVLLYWKQLCDLTGSSHFPVYIVWGSTHLGLVLPDCKPWFRCSPTLYVGTCAPLFNMLAYVLPYSVCWHMSQVNLLTDCKLWWVAVALPKRGIDVDARTESPTPIPELCDQHLVKDLLAFLHKPHTVPSATNP